MRIPRKLLARFSRLALILSGLALGACASVSDSPHYVVSPPGECCEAFDQMTFKALPAGKTVRLLVDSDDPGFSFKGGYSRYEALLLPDMSQQPYTLQFESEVVRTSEDLRGTMFFPVLTFLDENKKLIRTFDALPYTLQTPFYGRNHIRSSVRVIGELVKAKYVVVHTQDDKLNQALATSDGKTTLQSGGFTTMIYAPTSAPRYRINFGENGRLKVLAFAE